MLSLAHFSDLHACEKTKPESIGTLGFILDECAKRKVNLILNSGDTFDGPVNLGQNGPVTELIDELIQIPARLYVIQGTPSHDIPGAIDVFTKLSARHPIQVFKEPDSFRLNGSLAGHMSFLPALTKSYFARNMTASPEEMNQIIQEKLRAILADFGAKAADSPKPHILVAHFTVTGSETSTGQVLMGGDIQLSVADLSLANPDYVALGHIHKAQQRLPQHISYAGSPYHLNFGELEPKGFKIVTFDDRGELADIEFIETPSRPRQVLDAYWNTEFRRWEAPAQMPVKGADVRLRLYAPAHEMENEFIPGIEKAYLDAGVHSLKIETIPTTENRIRAAELADAKTIREELAEYGKAKGIEVSESAMAKADHLEEVIARRMP